MGRLTSMNFLQGLVIVSVLWSCDGVYGLNCINATQEVLGCFSGFQDVPQFNYAGILSIAKLCKTPSLDVYKTGVRCAVNVARQCPQELGLPSQEYTVDADIVIKGIEYLCQHIQDIDLTCVEQSLPKVISCLQRKLKEHQDKSASRASQICTTADLLKQCFGEVFGKCSGKTKDVALRFYQDYSVPPACRGCMNTISPLLLLLVFLLTCVHGACAELQARLTA